MIIFLYGPDGYRLKENLDTIVGAYRKKYESGMGYHRLDLSDGSGFDELANAVKSISFFDEAKLVVVKNSFSAGPVFLSKLTVLINDLNIADDPPSHSPLSKTSEEHGKASDGQGKKTVLVFVEGRTQSELQKANKDLFSFLSSKPNLVRNVGYLEGAKLSNWVRSKFKENGHSVSPAVASLLVDMVGKESWALANEIEKLSNYKRNSVIAEKDIGLLVGRKEVNNIFDLVDAVGSQNKAKAFEMMFRLINSGQDGHYLLSMLVYHFENLLSVSDILEKSGSLSAQAVAKKCGLHPFVAQKAISQTRKFQKNELLAKFSHLAGLDITSKNGQVNLEDSLYNFLFL